MKDDLFTREFAARMSKTDLECPFVPKPPKGCRAVFQIPEKDRGMWVIAATLKEAGFEEQGERMIQMLHKQTVRQIECGMLILEPRKYLYCSDWCVYVEPRRK